MDDIAFKLNSHIRLLNAYEVAELLGISKSKVYQLLNEGLIPVIRLGGSLRVDPSDLAQYIDQCKTSRVNQAW